MKSELPKKTFIDSKYYIQFFISKGKNSDSYRVKDKDGHPYFLKLFDLSKLHRTQFDSEGNVKEIEFLKKIAHENIVSFIDSGEWFYQNERFSYLVLEYISGENLTQISRRNRLFSAYEVKIILKALLSGLHHLHTQEMAILHNNVRPENIIIDYSNEKKITKLVDFGYARLFRNSTKVFYREGLNPFYLAPECFNNIFSIKSDIFSVGATAYYLMFGLPPWYLDLSDYQLQNENVEDLIEERRKRPIEYLEFEGVHFDDEEEHSQMLGIVKKALNTDPDERFTDCLEMILALDGKIKLSVSSIIKAKSTKQEEIAIKKLGGGFKDIAGMQALKETLYNDVIRAINEKELYQKYGLTIPNGILLYGPPGCGKSFFAQKLAEEIGCNFKIIKPSDLASIYVHGSQEKIGKLFDEAMANAPFFLNFEEFDAFVPKRDGAQSSHYSAEVNEFLTQLNNCGERGVFVIATTNQPLLIDTAVLRSGRIDKSFYIPPPDLIARQELFKIHLKNRPIDFGIDYEKLSKMTENYVSSDINLIVNEAARQALMSNEIITQKILDNTLENSKPSIGLEDLSKYNDVRNLFEGNRNQKNKRFEFGFTSE
ncbi:MAG: AAA family ATPase [Melioribacteraceae bacterium]|nr:AAA family ATPase [Melioribacteraceae bacterium]MCF8265662.1 AAA family ATPase [Melioribacteraceae bacterium]